jgi:hypothetical protein
MAIQDDGDAVFHIGIPSPSQREHCLGNVSNVGVSDGSVRHTDQTLDMISMRSLDKKMSEYHHLNSSHQKQCQRWERSGRVMWLILQD